MMMMRVVLAGVLALSGSSLRADLISGSQFIDVGGSYILQGGNAPTSFAESVTIGDSPSLVAGDTLEVSHEFVADGPNAEWVQIRIATVDGSAIGNPSLNWSFNYNDIPFVNPVSWDAVFFYWEEDGAAFDPINSFGGIQNQGNFSPFTGEPVYGGNPFGPVNDLAMLDLFIFVNPFGFVNSGGNDANTADAFVFGFHIFNPNPVAVPEPGTMTLVGLGAFGLVAGAFRRRRTAE